MNELDRIKQAMADGEHTDGDLEYAVGQWDRASTEVAELKDMKRAACACEAYDVSHRRNLTATAEGAREEAAHSETIDQRDRAEKWADKLAYAIGEHFDVDVGEHSNLNCLWEEAFDAIPARASGKHLHEYVMTPEEEKSLDDALRDSVTIVDSADSEQCPHNKTVSVGNRVFCPKCCEYLDDEPPVEKGQTDG